MLLCRDLCRQTLDAVLQRPSIRTTHPLPNLLTILQEHKGGHGGHLELLSHSAHLVHVDLDESHIRISLAELTDLGGNSLAGSAPSGVEVDNRGSGRGQCLEDDIAVSCVAS